MLIYVVVAILIVCAAVYHLAEKGIFDFFLFVVFIFNLIPPVISFKLSESSPEIKLNQVLLFVLILWMIFGKQRAKALPFDGWLFYPMLALLVIRFLSVFSSSDQALSLRVWITTVFTWFFFYYAVMKFVQSEEDMVRLLRTLLVSACIVSGLSVVELITGINLTQSDTFDRYERYGIPRVHGILGDPVATAYYLLPIIPFGFYLYSRTRQRRWLAATIFTTLALIPSFSRISFLALIIMQMLFVLFFSMKKMRLGIVAFAVVAVISLTDNVIKQSTVDLFLEVQQSEDSSFDSKRTAILTSTVFVMIEQVPPFGLGVGSLTRNELLSSYFAKVGFMYTEESIRTEMPILITFALECGIGASIAFLLMYFRSIIISFMRAKAARNEADHIAKYAFVALVGYFVCLMANGVTNSLNILFILFGIVNVARHGFEEGVKEKSIAV